MVLRDLIQPKWKHSNPKKRRQAVRRLKSHHIKSLTEVATKDPDTDIRIEAATKISDIKVLEDISLGVCDDLFRKACLLKMNELVRESSDEISSGQLNIFIAIIDEIKNEEDIVSAAFTIDNMALYFHILEKIENEKIVCRLALEINDPDFRMKAIEKISDESFLSKLTENNCGKKAGKAIVDKMTSEKYLKKISKSASNKKIKKMAQMKLKSLKGDVETADESKEDHSLDKALQNLLARMTDAENIAQAKTLQNAISDIEIKWLSIDPEKKHTLRKTFEEKLQALNLVREELEKKEILINILDDTCQEVDALSSEVDENTEQKLNGLKEKWADADISKLGSSERDRYNEKFRSFCDRLEKYCRDYRCDQEMVAERIDKLEAYLKSFEAFCDKPPTDESHSQLEGFLSGFKECVRDAKEVASYIERFEKLKITVQQKYDDFIKNKQKIIDREKEKLQSLYETVQTAIQAEKLFDVERDVRAAQKEWNRIGSKIPEFKEELTPQFKSACNRFFEKLYEHKENLGWEQWANLNIKRELCEAVERISIQENLTGISQMVREAWKEWKNVGPVPRADSDAIWKRFRDACDQVNHKAFKRKSELYEMAKDLIDNSQKGESVSDKIKALQAEWNVIGSLPLSIEKELKDNFRAMCDSYFSEARDAYQKKQIAREKNLEIKTSLCDRAEILEESPCNNQTINEYKELQKKWKTTGPVPKEEGDVLWNKFQASCNRFFDRLETEKHENLQKKEMLCKEAESIFEGIHEDSNEDEIRQGLIDLQKKWKEVGPVPRENSDEIWERFRKPCDAFFNQYNEKLEQSLALKESLANEAESLKDSSDWKETGEKLKDLQKEWKKIGYASSSRDRELWNRFHNACNYFFERSHQVYEEKNEKIMWVIQKKEELCLQTELLAKILKPDTEFDFQSRIPMDEQLHLSLEYKDEVIVPGDERATLGNIMRKVANIRSEWKNAGNIPGEKDKMLWKRFCLAEREIQSCKQFPKKNG